MTGGKSVGEITESGFSLLKVSELSVVAGHDEDFICSLICDEDFICSLICNVLLRDSPLTGRGGGVFLSPGDVGPEPYGLA